MHIGKGTIQRVQNKLANLQERDARGGDADTNPAENRVQYDTYDGISNTTTQAYFTSQDEGVGYYEERILKDGKVIRLETGSIDGGQPLSGETTYNAEITTYENVGDDVWTSSFKTESNHAVAPSSADEDEIRSAMEFFQDGYY